MLTKVRALCVPPPLPPPRSLPSGARRRAPGILAKLVCGWCVSEGKCLVRCAVPARPCPTRDVCPRARLSFIFAFCFLMQRIFIHYFLFLDSSPARLALGPRSPLCAVSRARITASHAPRENFISNGSCV